MQSFYGEPFQSDIQLLSSEHMNNKSPAKQDKSPRNRISHWPTMIFLYNLHSTECNILLLYTKQKTPGVFCCTGCSVQIDDYGLDGTT